MVMDTEQPATEEATGSPIQRDEPTLGQARRLLVERWKTDIKAAKTFWEGDFKRMKRDMSLAKLGADGEWVKGGNYTANILQRHVNQKVASLYAKDPKATFERAPRLDFEVWDGTMESLVSAQALAAADPENPVPMQLLQDITQGVQRRKMFDKIGETLVILFHYFLKQGSHRFKRQAKQAVRRALVTGVAYQEIGFQRLMEKRPEITAQMEDVTQKLAAIETLSADLADGVLSEDEAGAEELRQMLADLQSQEEMVVREGLVFDWPKSTEIIPDPNTRQIDGWIGTGWIVREFSNMTAQEIKETWQIDVTRGAEGSTGQGTNMPAQQEVPTHDGNSDRKGGDTSAKFTVWKVWHKKTGHEFVIADNWPDYIKEPAAPDITLEQFFPVLSLQFNPVEDDQDKPKDTRVFGLSEIELLQDMQNEYNRARQGLREHRHANRPGYVAARGQMEPDDKAALETHPANAVIEMTLTPGQKIGDLIDEVPKAAIDPALYDVSPSFVDIQRVGGSQAANLGGTKGDTATESTIAEGSRVETNQSNIDDLDDFLTESARSSGQVLLLNMTRDQVTKIAGPGAVWPEFTAQETAEEIFLTIKAGSSGRPNRQLQIANFERLAPILLQIPGVQPQWLAEQAIRRLGDDIDLEDAILDGLPSIIAANAAATNLNPGGPGDAKSKGTADDPNAQGGAGAQNAPNPQTNEGGPQAAFPAAGGGGQTAI